MKLTEFSFLADENIGLGLVEFIRQQGLITTSILESGQFGKSDLELLQTAFGENQVILTQDSDFGTLVFRDKVDFVGILYLRPGHFSDQFHIATVKTILEADLDLTPPFIIVAENTGETVKLRIRNFN